MHSLHEASGALCACAAGLEHTSAPPVRLPYLTSTYLTSTYLTSTYRTSTYLTLPYLTTTLPYHHLTLPYHHLTLPYLRSRSRERASQSTSLATRPPSRTISSGRQHCTTPPSADASSRCTRIHTHAYIRMHACMHTCASERGCLVEVHAPLHDPASPCPSDLTCLLKSPQISPASLRAPRPPASLTLPSLPSPCQAHLAVLIVPASYRSTRPSSCGSRRQSRRLRRTKMLSRWRLRWPTRLALLAQLSLSSQLRSRRLPRPHPGPTASGGAGPRQGGREAENDAR